MDVLAYGTEKICQIMGFLGMGFTDFGTKTICIHLRQFRCLGQVNSQI